MRYLVRLGDAVAVVSRRDSSSHWVDPVFRPEEMDRGSNAALQSRVPCENLCEKIVRIFPGPTTIAGDIIHTGTAANWETLR